VSKAKRIAVVGVGALGGYELKPDMLPLASDGNSDAIAEISELMTRRTHANPRGDTQLPAMRRTSANAGRPTSIYERFHRRQRQDAGHCDAVAREARLGL
jgi:hypothetical protein